MTYRQFLKRCQQVPDNRLDDDMTVFNSESEEYIPVKTTEITRVDNDVLDEGHIVIVI